ncbi:MAG: DUF4214 domain-containing protein [Actinomycetota bacterium]|nr:DUF4214 domain-containing protein [Actinomycetota bacterium]
MIARPSLRMALLGLVAVATLGSVLLVDAGTARAASSTGRIDVCRSHPSFSEVTDGVLVPGLMPDADAAIIVGDPDAEEYPMVVARYPDETGLWASSGIRGIELAVAATATTSPTGALIGLAPARSDAAVSDSIVRIYCGLLGREADALDIEYWSRRYWNGLPLSSIAEAFTTSNEFVDRHGDPTDEALVTILYHSVLGREPGEGGVEPFVDMLRAGEMSRGDLVVAFTDSPEFVATTSTVTPEKPALPYPAVGSGRRVIYANREARVWFVEATGELAKTHQVSGRLGVPAPDRYNVYSKSRYAWAPYDNVTMEYMVRFAREEWPYGFHSIPIHEDKSPFQTKEQLGTLRSGGCVRQDFDDAEWTFGWADVGTRVIMIP